MSQVWSQLSADERIRLGPLGKSQTFYEFVTEAVPEIIESCVNEEATFEAWTKVQFMIASTYAEIVPSRQNQNIARSLSGHKTPEMFLAVHGVDEEGYALQLRGLFEEEYLALGAGETTIGELFDRNPVAFFGRMLPSNKLVIN
jgi:hypothetical protein